MTGKDDDTTLYSALLLRCLLRHSSRRVLVTLIVIVAVTVPFLLLQMRTQSPIVSGSQYPMLPEDMKKGIVDAFRKEEEGEDTKQQIYNYSFVTDQNYEPDTMAAASVDASKGHVLIVTEHFQTGSRLLQQISVLLDAQRIGYTVVDAKDEKLEHQWQLHSSNIYSVIVFDTVLVYVGLGQSKLHSLHSYCRVQSAGLLVFPGSFIGRVPPLATMVQKPATATTIWVDAKSSLLRVLKGGRTLKTSVEAIPLMMRRSAYYNAVVKVEIKSKVWKSVVIDDRGVQVGARRVVFGLMDLSLWMVKLLFVDVLRSLSPRPLGYMMLERKILVDIDDIFVAKSGTKFVWKDVQAMVDFQDWIQTEIPGFRFNLGLSGWYYLKSSLVSEQDGDRAVVEKASHFWWFGHIFDHSQPHLHNTTASLVSLMQQNKQFTRSHNIPIEGNHYSIAPHHSGVYPVHEALYEAWRHVWDVRVTSTEEYPHLRPAYSRRGFIYKGISVLPRQTCGLFTHTYMKSDYPGGFDRMVESVEGGEVFFTIINSPVAVFMTHLSNYGNDRLALVWLNMTVQFIKKWTNLRLSTSPPVELAKYYFSLFPDEATTPFWQNPCQDKRHVEIWPKHKECRLPSVVVIGPQKTGTTALHQFLSLHPELQSNRLHPTSYEELQFFRDPNYGNGLDWYMSFFPSTQRRKRSNASVLLFEKSANYFDYPLAPKRMSYLLPKAKLIAILLNPMQRSYSWYQHQRSHGEKTALHNSFHDVITQNSSCSNQAVCALRNRCLIPGHYAEHLNRWLTYYKPSQIHLVDGDELVRHPELAMDKIQKFLGITTYDYLKWLRYDRRKGFFCEAQGFSSTKCLGKGKGRVYQSMDNKSRQFLTRYFRPHNVQLKSLLLEHHWTIPSWLDVVK